MNENLPARGPTLGRAHCSALARTLLVATLGATACFLSPLAAQTTITILNSSFEVPSPSVFPDYTVGATGWTRTRADINAGTFAPGLTVPTPPTPAPIDGAQVGYADGSGGLQQVFTDTFAVNQLYTFSVYIGYRSDEVNSVHGTGAITLGYFDAGAFTPLSTQSATVTLGKFNLVTGSYQTAPGAIGLPIAIQLTNLDSFQVLFDVAQLSFTAIPEPSAYACVLGAVVLGLGWWRRRMRLGAGR